MSRLDDTSASEGPSTDGNQPALGGLLGRLSEGSPFIVVALLVVDACSLTASILGRFDSFDGARLKAAGFTGEYHVPLRYRAEVVAQSFGPFHAALVLIASVIVMAMILGGDDAKNARRLANAVMAGSALIAGVAVYAAIDPPGSSAVPGFAHEFGTSIAGSTIVSYRLSSAVTALLAFTAGFLCERSLAWRHRAEPPEPVVRPDAEVTSR